MADVIKENDEDDDIVVVEDKPKGEKVQTQDDDHDDQLVCTVLFCNNNDDPHLDKHLADNLKFGVVEFVHDNYNCSVTKSFTINNTNFNTK